MCGTAMRGADALPGSKATSRAKGSHRKLGGLGSGRRYRVGAEYDGPHLEGQEPKPMMHGHEKSDLATVALKSANKAEQSAAESVARRTVTKGNADRQSTHWTQRQARVSQALDRIRHVFAVTHPRWEPYAGKPPVRFCAGGARGNARPYRYNAASSSRCSARRDPGSQQRNSRWGCDRCARGPTGGGRS